MGPSCLFSSHPVADCPSLCLLGEGRGTSYLPRKPYLFQDLPLTIQRAQRALIFETDAVMEISIHILVSEISSFNWLLLSERLHQT